MVHIVLPSISYYGADVTRLRFTPVTLGSRLRVRSGAVVEGQGVRGAPARAGPVRRDRSGHIRYSLISVRLAYNVNSRASLARPAGTRTGPPHAPIAAEGEGTPEYDRPGLPARADHPPAGLL